MLTLTFLGVGCAFAKRNYQSNALVEAWSKSPDEQNAPDETLLIDFGATGPLALHKLKDRAGFRYLDHAGSINYSAVQHVFITHLHNDHIGGLEELALCNLLGNRGVGVRPWRSTILGTRELLDRLWQQSLRGGLGVMNGREAGLEDYFEVVLLDPTERSGRDCFTMLDRYDLRPFATDHLRLSRRFDWPSFGLSISDRLSGQIALYSGDTRFDPQQVVPRLQAAEVIFHEVQLVDSPDPVHTLLRELRSLPREVRRRMWLYHYADTWDSPDYRQVGEEFLGFASPHHRYQILA